MWSSACVVAIVFCGPMELALGEWKPENELRTFSKTLADNSTLAGAPKKLWEKVVETELRPSAGARGETEALFSYRLTRVAGKVQEVIWQKNIPIYAPSGDSPKFILKDAEIAGGTLYILYALDGFLHVEGLRKDRSGGWSTVMSARLTDLRRALWDCRFFHESGGLAIRCIDENRGLARDGVWDIRDGTLRKRAAK